MPPPALWSAPPAPSVVVIGLRLPLTGEPPPKPRGVSGTEEPGHALDALLAMLASRPTLLAAVVIAAVAAASAPLARSRGLWGAAVWGATFLAVLLLVPLAAGGTPVDPLWAAPAVWLATGALAYPLVRAPG